MRIQTTDGYIFEGADAKEIVRKMRDTQWGTPVLKREYMQEVADRVTGAPGMTKIVIDQGANAFLASLSANKLIRIVPDNEIITDDTTFEMDDAENDARFDADAEASAAYHDEEDRIARETEYNELNDVDDVPAYEPDPRD